MASAVPTHPFDDIFSAYEDGHPALLVSGRSLYDFVLDGDKVVPGLAALRRRCREQCGMHLLIYSMAQGLDWDAYRLMDVDRQTVERALRAHRLLDIPQDQNEVVRVIRGISGLGRHPAGDFKWSNSQDVRFAFLLEFAQHLAPGSLTNGTQSDAQLVAIELAHITAQSLALRASGNLLLFHGSAGQVDPLVADALHHVRLCQPGREEKVRFLQAALRIYPQAAFEPNLDFEAVAHLTANTPNRSQEGHLRASHRAGGRPIAAADLVAQKSRDVEELSEHTLTVLDTSRAAGLELHGRNIRAASSVLDRLADGLRRGDPSTPANIILVGPPGNGKTDLAVVTAARASVSAYTMHSPKRGIVGETERVAEQQHTLLEEWGPNVAFADEITESLPMERSDFDGDSGASRAVMAALLTALSNESRRGRSMIIGTTNCPWRISAAMRSRFTMLPVLHPLAEDFPGIVISTARRVRTGIDFKAAEVREAAELFYRKGANPRHIRAQLSLALQLHGELTTETVLFAAQDFCGSMDLDSVYYADWWALKCCSSHSFLPWSDDVAGYAWPAHLEGVVHRATGEIDQRELDKRIAELRPHANL